MFYIYIQKTYKVSKFGNLSNWSGKSPVIELLANDLYIYILVKFFIQ